MNRQTLRFHSARPVHKRRDTSGVPCAAVAERVRHHVHERYSSDTRSPETEAIRFYLLNHAMADLRQMYGPDDPLPEAAQLLVETYHTELNELAVRMFAYLVLITTRESRHGQNPDSLFTAIEKQFGAGAKAFNLKIKGYNENQALETWMTSPPEDCTIGQYVDMMQWLFYASESGFHGGFGGKKWGVIADLVCDYVHGRINAEMMLDTAFTLAHNGGPIFNKGMCFTNYHTSTLMAVLDIQASGQIPQLILEAGHYNLGQYATAEIRKLHKIASEALGGAYQEPLDWWLVEAEGKEVGQHYHVGIFKEKQVELHGYSPLAAEIEKTKAAEAKAVAAKQAAELAEQQKAVAGLAAKKAEELAAKKEKQYQYGPGNMVVEKIEREAA